MSFSTLGAWYQYTGELNQPEGLGHLPGTGLVVPGRSTDEQHAPGRRWVVVPPLGFLDRRPRLQPFDRQLELGVGEAGTGFPLPGTLVVFVVARPGDFDDAVDLGADLVERGVVEALAQAPGELFAAQLDVALARADFGRLPTGCIGGRHG
jgi:hypothetical protein